jgi:hypothetical protein
MNLGAVSVTPRVPHLEAVTAASAGELARQTWPDAVTTDEHRARRARASRRLFTRRNAAGLLNRSGPRGERTGRCAHSRRRLCVGDFDVAYMKHRYFDERHLRGSSHRR